MKYYENGVFKRDSFSIDFIDCKFDLENGWKEKKDGEIFVDDSYKQFMVIDLIKGGTANIKFIRCYTTNENESLNLIKVAGDKEVAKRINIEGENNRRQKQR